VAPHPEPSGGELIISKLLDNPIGTPSSTWVSVASLPVGLGTRLQLSGNLVSRFTFQSG
jgi:hypothetical protein